MLLEAAVQGLCPWGSCYPRCRGKWETDLLSSTGAANKLLTLFMSGMTEGRFGGDEVKEQGAGSN